MKKVISLKSSREFSQVYNHKESLANKYLVMYIQPNDQMYSRIGISVSKKVGNSVVRHRIKRLIKESYRLNIDKIASGYDIIVIARYSAKGKTFSEIESALLHLCLKGHGTCIFYPTCSEYALQAYEKYGFFKGTLLTVWRLLRCNPFNKGGYDPVP